MNDNNEREVSEIRRALYDTVRTVVVLQDDSVLDLMLVALMTGGHILFDDVPGVGKTLLARSFALALGLKFGRIQFTPDLLPSDITGLNFYNQRNGDFEFRPGPVFTNILLADEINRATPRTQSSLLECMQEATVTVDGSTRSLDAPFMVIATQNPVEMEGTFPLPEAQMDRFLLCLRLGYPDEKNEREISLRFMNADPVADIKPAVTAGDISVLRQAPAQVHMSPEVLDYAVGVARATRDLEGIRLGASPRGALFLARAAQALAAARGRSHVLPDDVQDAAVPVLGHRLIPDVDSALYGVTGAELVRQVLMQVDVPVGNPGANSR